MKISILFVSIIWLFTSVVAQAATLDFPDLSLASSPEQVRSWVQKHQYKPTHPSEPGQMAYQRTHSRTQYESLYIMPGKNGVDMLRFDKSGVLESARKLRQEVYQRFGKPKKDQILKDGTLRLTYSYNYSEPARRVFLLKNHFVSMLLMKEAFVTRVNAAPANTDKQHTDQASADTSILTRYMPAIWVVGGILGLIGLIMILPRPVREPITGVVLKIFGPLISLTQELLTFLHYQAAVFLCFGMALLSTLGVGSGALEWGTSWWWFVPVIYGAFMVFKADNEEDGFLTKTYIATAFFTIALAGVFVQRYWDQILTT